MIRAQFVYSNRWSEAREAGCAKQTDNGAATEPHDIEHRSGVTSHREETNRALDFKAGQDFWRATGCLFFQDRFYSHSNLQLCPTGRSRCSLRIAADKESSPAIRASLGLLVTAAALMNALIITVALATAMKLVRSCLEHSVPDNRS
jgi:hypothetical protein